MKQYTQTVTSCLECPNSTSVPSRGWCCLVVNDETQFPGFFIPKKILGISMIPGWCPLEDAK